MTIQHALQQGHKTLAKNDIPSSILDATILLAFVLHQNKEHVFTYPEKEISNLQVKHYHRIISERAKGVPVSYLTHEKYFYGLEFYVNRSVLIPRPETEMVVTLAVEYIKSSRRGLPTSVADIGCGSGAIAVAIKKTIPKVKMLATDLSSKALTVAKRNADHHKTSINFFKGDLLEPLTKKKLDIIVANLPYIDSKEQNAPASALTLGLTFEPKDALYSGKDGLDHYSEFFKQLSIRKNLPKMVIIEIGHNQASLLGKIIKSYFPRSTTKTHKDLCGLDRIMTIAIK